MNTENKAKLDELKKGSWFKDVFLPIGSVLIGFLGLVAQHLPAWIVVVAALYLCIAGIIGIVFPCRLVVPSVVGLKSLLRARRFAYVNLPELTETVRGLQKLLAPQNSNTLIYVLELAVFHDQTAGRSVPADPEHLSALRNWGAGIEERARLRRTRDFLQLSKELSYLLQEYNHFLCRRVEKLQKFIDSSNANQGNLRDMKQRWNVNRDAHLALVRKWEDVARKINDSADTKVCLDYYEPLGTLE